MAAFADFERVAFVDRRGLLANSSRTAAMSWLKSSSSRASAFSSAWKISFSFSLSASVT
jgi:hypothetical protein